MRSYPTGLAKNTPTNLVTPCSTLIFLYSRDSMSCELVTNTTTVKCSLVYHSDKFSSKVTGILILNVTLDMTLSSTTRNDPSIITALLVWKTSSTAWLAYSRLVMLTSTWNSSAS